MNFTFSSLKETAEQFHQYTTALKIGFKSKAKAYDLWAQILSGKNYSALASRLKLENDIAYEFNIEAIGTLFKDKHRDVTGPQILALMAHIAHSTPSILRSTEQLLIGALTTDKTASLIVSNDDGLGVINNDKPGYADVRHLRYSNHARADDIRRLLLTLAGQSDEKAMDVFGGMIKNGSEAGNQRFKSIMRHYKGFTVFLSEYIFSHLDIHADFIGVKDVVTDSIGALFKHADIGNTDFLEFDTPLVEDFIEGISGSIMSALAYYHETDDEEYIFDCDVIAFPIRQKIKFYTGT